MEVFTLPTPEELMAGITAWSSTMFTEHLPIVFLSVGLIAVVFGAHWFIDIMKDGFKRLFGGKNKFD